MNKNLRSEAPPPEPPRNNPCSLGIACIYDLPYLYISCKPCHDGSFKEFDTAAMLQYMIPWL